MSGIYIPGMELPKRCLHCPCSGTDEDGGKELWICEITHRLLTSTELCDDTPGDCPLIPVPEHGRLIDADALEDRIKKVMDILRKQYFEDHYPYDGAKFDGLSDAGRMVTQAPTIIPADKEGEG